MRQNPDYATGLQDISAALIACGYTKLDKQAKALGVRRSTAAIAFRVLPKWLAPRKQLSLFSVRHRKGPPAVATAALRVT
jgi:hypothetical protein